MEGKYEIKGIDKILGTVSKEDLARYFEVEQDEDFEALITESLKIMGVPSGLEIAGYEARNYEGLKKGMDGYLQELCEKYIKGGKAAIGINYPLTKENITELYFYIDEPIRNETLSKMEIAKTHLGGVITLGHTMGKGFYEAHKDEITKFQEESSKSLNDQRAFDDYVRDYFDRLSGKKVKEDARKEYYFDWERENEQKEKERMQGAEQLIFTLTGGKTIEDVTLQDLEQIKQALEERKAKVEKSFSERFGTKEDIKGKE